MPKLIERNSQNTFGTMFYCQLYQGPLCVALGKSRIGSEKAIKNAYHNYQKSNKKEDKMPNKIVIIVEGGVVQEVYGPDSTQVVIMDYDNFGEDENVMDNSRERFDLNVDNEVEGLTLIG